MDLFQEIFGVKIAYASVDSFIANVNKLIINPLITFLFALAIVFFLYGVVEFMMNQDNEEKKTTGKSHMLWGIVGLTIMMGVFTLMNIILKTFNIKGIVPEEGKVELSPYTPSK